MDRLLRAGAEAGSFLERPLVAPELTATHVPSTADEPAAAHTGREEVSAGAGTVIAGRYKLLEVIGEAAGKVSASFKADHPDIPWPQIIGLRHRLIHGYADVRLEVVWVIATGDLEPLIATLRVLAPSEDDWSS